MPKHRIGTIHENANGTFRVRVQRGDVVRTETVRGTRLDAELRCSQIASELGTSNAWSSSITLSEYYFSVFRNSQSNRGTVRTKGTMYLYDKYMNDDFLPYIGNERLSSITHEQIASLILNSSSPTNAKKAIRAILRKAYDDGLLPSKPLDRRVPTHTNKRPPVKPWSATETLEAIKTIPQENTLMGVFLCLGLSGLRKEECLGTRWEDIQDNFIHVLWVFTNLKGHVPLPKNEHSERVVPVFPLLRDFLEEQRNRGRCVPLNETEIAYLWRKTLKKCSLRYIPPKALRHTSDTLMLQAQIPPDLNAKMHGRTNPTVTYSHYFNPSQEAMREAMQRVSDYVENSTQQTLSDNS